MALNKATMQETIRSEIYDGVYQEILDGINEGFKEIFDKQSDRAFTDDGSIDPKLRIEENALAMGTVCADVLSTTLSNHISTAVANALDTFVRSGDVYVGATNIIVTAPPTGGICDVETAAPAKMT